MTNSKVKSKRIISMLLSLILVFSAFSAMPITASAGTYDNILYGTKYTYGDYSFVINEDNTASITDYKGTSSKPSIPSVVKSGGKDYVVTVVSGFSYTDIESVTIPDSVIKIENNAFRECYKLKKVSLPSSVTCIESMAFYGCTSLTTFTAPKKLKEIGSSAFSECYNLKEVNLNKGLYSIGWSAFEYCDALSEVTIPSTVQIISLCAFGYLRNKYGEYKNENFIIYGTPGSAAQKYAEENYLIFIPEDEKIVAPQSITIPSSLTLGVGEKCMPNYKIYPANAMTDIFYTTSNSNVVAYDDYTQTLTAKKAGTATVTIHTTTNNKTASCKITVKNAPSSVKTNPTSLTLGKGETYTISECTNSGSYASAANLKWSSSNTSVAAVTKGSGNKAKITAKGVGTAYIKITLYNGKTASCKVTVKNAPTSVKTNPTSLTLGKGETYTISESTNSGTYANAGNLKWSSSDTSVAAVTKGSGNKAKITAKGVGTAYIKITLYNGKTASCKVTVKNAPTSVKLSSSSITLGKGKTFTVSESTNSGSYANAGNLKWSSSNTNVATVKKGSSNKAVITAKSKGTAYIKITLYNGKTAQCKVTVK